MQLFPSRRDVRRAQTRLVMRFFGVMAVLVIVMAIVVVGRYVLGLW